MQIEASEHFRFIVQPAVAAYLAAEQALTASEGDDRSEAAFTALREGGSAALYLHHFADIVAARGGRGLDDLVGSLEGVRRQLSALSIDENGPDYVRLLGDVADAIKHAVLTHRLPREIEAAGQVLTVTRGWSHGGYGQGKFGGASEVWVLARAGRRPLKTVVTTVSELWVRVLAGERAA